MLTGRRQPKIIAKDQAGRGASDSAVELTAVTFGYPGTPVIMEGIDLKVAPGEIVIIIGPSGCGKSTLLNLIAGLIRPLSGDVTTFGQPVNGVNRDVTYMTQRDTLLPWRSALDNAALPLELKGVGKRERHDRAREVLVRVGIGEAEKNRPHELSGGMRSRVSLARALLADAHIVLMDEPFAAIDALRRMRLQQLLIDLWQGSDCSIVYVTHDLNEALALGDRVVVMGRRPGRIVLERAISIPQPRDATRLRADPEAERLYVELWQALEKQFSHGR